MDAFSISIGALIGTSPIMAYIESATGISGPRVTLDRRQTKMRFWWLPLAYIRDHLKRFFIHIPLIPYAFDCQALATSEEDEPRIRQALESYHRQRLFSNEKISALLLKEHGPAIASSAVKRRHKALGFHSPRVTMRTMPYQEMVQLVVDELDRDHARSRGVQNIQAKITFNCGVTLSRDFVSDIMHTHDEEGFRMRDPTSKHILRVVKCNIGIHKCWSGDGHDKLYSIGFPIWAVVDEATSKWLGAWVVPSNRLGDIVGYLCLCLIEKFGGLVNVRHATPVCNGLSTLFPEYDGEILPAHSYVHSVHNIAIEWSWLRLCLDWGMESITPTMGSSNNKKAGPSGCSRNEAFSLHEKYGLTDCLLRIPDMSIIHKLKEEMGGDQLLEFVSPNFAVRCDAAYESLAISELSFENVWELHLANSCVPSIIEYVIGYTAMFCVWYYLYQPAKAIVQQMYKALSTHTTISLNISLNKLGTSARHFSPLPRGAKNRNFIYPYEKTTAHRIEPGTSDGLSSAALATSILHLASSYHSQASEPRLNNSIRTVGGVAQPRGLNKFKNLGKANQAVELRKAKQEEVKLLDNGIRISAVLWMVEGSSNQLTEIKTIRVVHVFEPTTSTCEAFDQLLGEIKISEDDDDDLDPVFVGSKRKYSSRQPANSLKRHSVVQLPSCGRLQQSSSVAAGPQSSSIQWQSNILKSAYRPANKPITTWTRNLALDICNFQWITAHFDLDGTSQVTTKEFTKWEVIEVSPPSQSESVGQAGFIGVGSTKCSIYA
ncbi:uncharacterized protein LACBIDRAFT_333554 [Laccaria bicolor S238N-H82]|uniref:Predicted protein n=1 Tax=Laccaria bicolor (strain S238N-H82 / ATCC MYA-4686) TaxID=486041 RepID=B0DWA6_LACBS|nr:uncharacterized protein LACBIDRAFT_333554 [Laccaria bicolor S238N-H82]EDR01155.1 predicted protein [Laccaria bicolor S238N-H82]|eukprot:XP_001888197.1 predicted protein [Laccaria bicolor S238N-H82]